MEYGLRQVGQIAGRREVKRVLILVVMEYGLRRDLRLDTEQAVES